MHNLKHGEAWFAVEQSVELINGEFIPSLKIKIPDPMPREEALTYYGAKLRSYWMENLDERIPVRMREKALDYLIKGGKK